MGSGNHLHQQSPNARFVRIAQIHMFVRIAQIHMFVRIASNSRPLEKIILINVL